MERTISGAINKAGGAQQGFLCLIINAKAITVTLTVCGWECESGWGVRASSLTRENERLHSSLRRPLMEPVRLNY